MKNKKSKLRDNSYVRRSIWIIIGVILFGSLTHAGDIYKTSVLILNATGGVKIIGGALDLGTNIITNTTGINVTNGNIFITGSLLVNGSTILPAGSTNVSIEYGWNGTNYVPLLTTPEGLLRLTVAQAQADNASSLGIGANGTSLTLTGTNNANNISLSVNNTLYVNASADRVGIGTASPGQTLTVVGDVNVTGTAYGSVGVVRSYPVTLANVSNTTAETTILSFVVPANSMSDGDLIVISMSSLAKNNKGTAGTITPKVYVGAGAAIDGYQIPSLADSATEKTTHSIIRLQRMGSTVIAAETVAVYFASISSIGAIGPGSSTPTNFTTDFTISIKLTLSAADPTFYIKPQSARVIHFK